MTARNVNQPTERLETHGTVICHETNTDNALLAEPQKGSSLGGWFLAIWIGLPAVLGLVTVVATYLDPGSFGEGGGIGLILMFGVAGPFFFGIWTVGLAVLFGLIWLASC